MSTLTNTAKVSRRSRITPTLRLTTTGWSSGRLRSAPLIYHRDDDRLIVSASGPATWPADLDACRYACVQIEGGAVQPVTGRRATPGEYERYRTALGNSGVMYVLEPPAPSTH